jgi:hypothetical protein
VKRAARDPIRPGLLERDIVLHDADNVRVASKIIDEGLWKTHCGLVLEFSYYFDVAHDVTVEFVKFFGRYPVLLMTSTAYSPGFITIVKRLSYTKPSDITTFRLVIFRIPITCNLTRVLLSENWIEEWLFGKSWGERRVVTLLNQFEFLLAYRTKQNYRISLHATH